MAPPTGGKKRCQWHPIQRIESSTTETTNRGKRSHWHPTLKQRPATTTTTSSTPTPTPTHQHQHQNQHTNTNTPTTTHQYQHSNTNTPIRGGCTASTSDIVSHMAKEAKPRGLQLPAPTTGWFCGDTAHPDARLHLLPPGPSAIE